MEWKLEMWKYPEARCYLPINSSFVPVSADVSQSIGLLFSCHCPIINNEITVKTIIWKKGSQQKLRTQQILFLPLENNPPFADARFVWKWRNEAKPPGFRDTFVPMSQEVTVKPWKLRQRVTTLCWATSYCAGRLHRHLEVGCSDSNNFPLRSQAQAWGMESSLAFSGQSRDGLLATFWFFIAPFLCVSFLVYFL